MPANLSDFSLQADRSSCARSDRGGTLAALSQIELPTPPAVALQVVQAAGRRNCTSAELVALLAQDPTLCAKLLRAVNSCVYGLTRPVASLEGAVAVLGLNPLRSLVLSLSLPAVQVSGPPSRAARRYGVASVSGGMFARGLAVRLGMTAPEDILMAGLLRDLGRLVLERAFPDQTQTLELTRESERPDRVAAAEHEAFGLDHAEVTAHLLQTWGLPKEVVEPIRFHHQPSEVGNLGPVITERAELLYFVEHLVHLDTVGDGPASLRSLLDWAETRYGLKKADLIAFLQGMAPKVSEFATLLATDISGFPDLAQVLAAGTETLVGLTVEANRTKLSGTVPNKMTRRAPAPAPPPPDNSMLSLCGGDDPPPADGIAFELRDHPRYRVIEKIGEGGMGAVYKAEHKLMGRTVAVKVVASKWVADPDAIERFRREARLAARLNHRNIVTAHDADEVNGCQCLVMEYVDGRSLDKVVAERGPLPVVQACQLTTQALEGLQHAHEQGMVHRDIKPHNLMLTPTGQLKILDFGLARLTEAGGEADRQCELTTPDDIIGTPDYLAPEQVRNSAGVDHRADLYGFGCTLFYLLTGRPPFNNGPPRARLVAHLEQSAPPLADFRKDLPPGLQTVLDRLMKKNPDERYQTAAEVVVALGPFMTERPAGSDPRNGTTGRGFIAALGRWLSSPS